MREQRWPWFVAAALMSGAGFAAAWATYLYWLPCRDSMLVGTVAEGMSPRRDFSDDCLRRMDAGLPFGHDVTEQIPWVREVSMIAVVLCSVAWLVLVLGLRWSARTKVLAGVVSLPGLLLWVISVAIPNGAALLGEAMTWSPLPLALLLLVALTEIYTSQSEVRGYTFVRVLVLLWGAIAFAFPQQAADYAVMSTWSSANWDVPPGTGVITVAALFASAVLTVIMTIWGPRPEDRSREPTAVRSARKSRGLGPGDVRIVGPGAAPRCASWTPVPGD